MKDAYIHDMTWCIDAGGFNLPQYRMYQYGLVKKYIGKKILEIGTGDREFTRLIERNNPDITTCVSLEPSPSFFQAFSKKKFPKQFIFLNRDLFTLTLQKDGMFDTALCIHVLEHIKEDKKAIDHIHTVLHTGGRLLIIVPANPWLFSDHDRSLGHYRRYTKDMIQHIVDPKKFTIEDMWYQDFIGIIGSVIYFKILNIRLKTTQGKRFIQTIGHFYDRYIIPFEQFLERFIRFPIGLTLTVVLKKR